MGWSENMDRISKKGKALINMVVKHPKTSTWKLKEIMRWYLE
jgi:hypothetical protein